MERVGIEPFHGFLVAAQLVEQSNFLEDEVIAALNEFRILLQEGEAFLMRTMQAFVELVEFHQHTLIVLIKTEGTLHVFERLRFPTLLVEPCEGKIAPYGGE